MTSDPYQYGGARVLVALHDRYLREFMDTWRRANDQCVALPATSNPSYASREALLHHVLSCAAHYLIWMCDQLGLSKPPVEEKPDLVDFVTHAEPYMEGVLEAWQSSLRGVTEAEADEQAFESRWGIPYSVDAMLEHAVMHPIRHTHQLEELMEGK